MYYGMQLELAACVSSQAFSTPASRFAIWEFPKIGVPYFEVLKHEDPTSKGTILGSPIFANSQTRKGSIELGP